MTSGVFPSDILAAARASQAKWGIPASVCLAQWALESAWGSAMPAGSNNPFGIKAVGTQPSVACLTHEVIGGKRIEITAKFRRFASMAEAFDAHGELLATNSHYANARTVRHNADAFARALTGTYATDPEYGSKLIATMSAHNLYVYDAVPGAAPAPSVAAKPVALPSTIVPAPKPIPTVLGRIKAWFSGKAA